MKQKRFGALLIAMLFIASLLCTAVFAEEEVEVDIGAQGSNVQEADLPQQEQQPAQQQETPKQEQQPAQQQEAPKQEQQPAQQSAAPADNGGSTGGYASPIVNIDAIEVPLADGTTIVLPFLDVPQDAYYTAAVAWAYSHDPQITGGVADDRFDPLATCTRGQMVTFLWRAAGCPEPTGTASAFSDVAAGAYYEKAVAWAVENNITDGVGDGRFAPNGIVNRAQAVTFLYRAKGAPETAASESFTDVASGAWYENAVAWAVANEITNGVGDNAFAPNANCVRGQTVTFLYRAYK